MNTTKLAAIATLLFLGTNPARAQTTAAWMDEGFIMEEVVTSAAAPTHPVTEQIVVTARAPARPYMEKIVVTAEPPEYVYLEKIAVTAIREELRKRSIASLRLLQRALLDRG